MNRNALKILTTRSERRLIKMQAAQNFLVLKKGEKEILEKDVLSKTEIDCIIADSTAFTSEDYELFLDDLYD